MKEKINKFLESAINGILFYKSWHELKLFEIFSKEQTKKYRRALKFLAFAEYYDIYIRMIHPKYLELRETWLELKKDALRPDPTIESIRLTIYCVFIFFFILFTFYVIVEFSKFFKHFKLYSFKNRHITRINFFKLSIEEKYSNAQFSELNVDLLPYEKILNSLDIFLATRFYESKNIQDFNAITADLNIFQQNLNQNLDYDLYNEIYDLIDLFPWIVKKNNENGFFWFIK